MRSISLHEFYLQPASSIAHWVRTLCDSKCEVNILVLIRAPCNRKIPHKKVCVNALLTSSIRYFLPSRTNREKAIPIRPIFLRDIEIAPLPFCLDGFSFATSRVTNMDKPTHASQSMLPSPISADENSQIQVSVTSIF